jgi:DNA/RNA-binding domain of Phe-tRNA-synthetase-like protein
MHIAVALADPSFLAAIVIARDIHTTETPPALAAEVQAAVAARAAGEPAPAHRDAVRALLRRGGYKPSGRGKPASEYLAQAAREGRFPSINNLVDANNLLSLEALLPVSLLDLAPFGGAGEVRYGRAGERYVFNAAGHELDLAGLLCVCGAGGAPLGTPVKDSMAGKVKPDTRDVLGLVWGAREVAPPERMRALGERFAGLLTAYAGARAVEAHLIP